MDDPDQAVSILASAIRRLATGRPGPILLSLPRDVQEVEIEVREAAVPSSQGTRGPAADRAAVRRVVKLLAASERGVIVAGGGVLRARATKRLVALSEALAVPVIAAWRRPDVFPNDHPNYLGMAGTWAPHTVRRRLEDADVIAFIGTRLSEVTTHHYAIPGPGTRWAHVDIQPRSAGAGLPAPTISVEADASRFLDAAWSDLRAAALDNEMRSRREARTAADREAYRAASEVGQGTWSGPGVHPGRIVDSLRRVLPDNAVITTDAGNMVAGWPGATVSDAPAPSSARPLERWASACPPRWPPRSRSDRIAAAICGDGGFAMSMMELETAVREGAHPIVLVFDNERYGTIAMGQSREGRSSATSDLGSVDFAAVARAHGALGFSVSDDDDVRERPSGSHHIPADLRHPPGA